MAERISVIVATYNRPDALDAVLRSLERQSDTDFEVLVADDGSTPPTKELIDAWQPRFNGRLHHVWHPDDGFRLAEIRNRAILVASGDYCIFLDGDCIARTDFVAAHLNPAVVQILARMQLSMADIDRFICHPGGARVITALESAFSLNQGTLDHERQIIADYGNMSAPTVLFVLERARAKGLPARSLLTALGPGFTASCVTLRHAA